MAQKDDLVKAKESLMSTIGEIEGVASATFMESFNKIKEHCVRVFRSLFTEDDQCDLRLVDPNNPLESEIDIIAKPKGKRPTVIDQLSGGEKTLTATALLFSLYLLKPAPFCIFDEVDAPFDDTNISKLIPASTARGGLEISVEYILTRFKPKKVIHRICPDYI
jgi:chromosome segregation protein